MLLLLLWLALVYMAMDRPPRGLRWGRPHHEMRATATAVGPGVGGTSTVRATATAAGLGLSAGPAGESLGEGGGRGVLNAIVDKLSKHEERTEIEGIPKNHDLT